MRGFFNTNDPAEIPLSEDSYRERKEMQMKCYSVKCG